MPERSDRLSTSVTPEQKLQFEILARREDKSESQLLRELVEEKLDDEDIPEEVLNYFREEGDLGNPKAAAMSD